MEERNYVTSVPGSTRLIHDVSFAEHSKITSVKISPLVNFWHKETLKKKFTFTVLMESDCQLLRLKMFREDHGSWMTMSFSTILFLFLFSHIYNTILLMDGNMGAPYPHGSTLLVSMVTSGSILTSEYLELDNYGLIFEGVYFQVFYVYSIIAWKRIGNS
ncbi:transmembrane protein [Cricetulus griseus]|uniref:Transmembrane protein n=1 Tax=Cricetulus griseus TaxID=10029 RepID=A0A061IFA8_CRIGR|nr:transmembrane protein [Cricetulus griseus]